ncbi:hypothetical protein B0H13DRAFT_1884547 [Mycena leptocephala]|nr:hypothetical protein B0H13DRAFT_1884547 [Mycena leptocephala]
MAHERRMRNSCASGDDRDARCARRRKATAQRGDSGRRTGVMTWHRPETAANNSGLQVEAGLGGGPRMGGRRNWQETRGSNGMLRSEKRVAGEAAATQLGNAIACLTAPRDWFPLLWTKYSGYCVQFSITFEELGRAALALTPGMSSVVAPRLVRVSVRGRYLMDEKEDCGTCVELHKIIITTHKWGRRRASARRWRYGGECGGGVGAVTASAAVLWNAGGAAESQVPVRRVEVLVVGVR